MKSIPILKSHPRFTNKSLGFVFYGLYLLSASFLIYQYGPAQGGFLWYHLLAFLGFGLALTFHKSSLALPVIALSLPQEIFWLSDHLIKVFLGHSPFHLMEALFQPGLSAPEFALAHIHYLYVPAAIVTLHRLPEKPKRPFLVTSLLHLLLFAVSFYFFDADADPNCARVSCIGLFDSLPATLYPYVYGGIYWGFSLLLLTALRSQFSRQVFSRLSLRGFLLLFLGVSLTAIGRASWIYLQTPRFRCVSSENPEAVSIRCLHTTDYGPGFLRLNFAIINQSARAQNCGLYISEKEKKERMYESVLLRGKSRIELSVTLPNPTRSAGMTATLSTECTQMP